MDENADRRKTAVPSVPNVQCTQTLIADGVYKFLMSKKENNVSAEMR